MDDLKHETGERPGIGVVVLFFFSGAAGLIYQVLWQEELALYFGRTWVASALVLSVFMGGLALGALVAGKFADRLRMPLLVYSFLETGLAATVLLSDYIFAWLRPFYQESWHSLGGEGPWLVGVQLLVTCLALFPATMLMGATMPVLARFSARGSFRRDLPRLYGANTVGAAAGALTAAFFLIPGIGLTMTRLLAVAITLAVAFFAGRMAKQDMPSQQDLKADIKARLNKKPADRIPLPPRSILFTGAALSSGLLILGLEVFWTHTLALTFGSTVYAFGLMLAAFLCGLGLASLLCARLCAKGIDPRHLLVIAFSGGGLAVICSTLCMGGLPWISAWLVRTFATNFMLFTVARFTLLFILLALPAILFGLAVPALVVAARRKGREGADTGFIYAANLIGSVIGPLLAGFLILPRYGSRPALLGTGVLLCLIGLPFTRGIKERSFTAIAAVTGFAILILLPTWNLNLLTSGFHLYALSHPAESLEHALDRRKPIWVGEGMQGTAAVIDFTNQQGRQQRTYSLNGKYEGSSNPDDMRTQTAVGEIPVLTSPRPVKEVYLLGLGTGTTAAALLRHPISRLDICELSPEVVHIAQEYFGKFNNNCLADKRLNLVLADGRHWLDLQQKQWDAVISEPSNPWMAGVASLYTLESFRSMRAHTKPGGIVCQWVQGYLISEDTYRTVLRTWLKVFPSSLAMLPDRKINDIILLGFVHKDENTEVRINLEEVKKRLGLRSPYPFGETYGPTNGPSIFKAFLMGPKRLKKYAGKGPLHQDDQPILQYEAPLELYRMQAEIKRWETLPTLLEPPHDYLDNLNVADQGQLFREHIALTTRLFLGGSERDAINLPTTTTNGLVKHMRQAANDPRCQEKWLPLWLAGHFLLYGNCPGKPNWARLYARGYPRMEALTLLAKATQDDPRQYQPFIDLAQTLAKGSDGEIGGPGCNPEGALKVTGQALKLKPLQKEMTILRSQLLFALDRPKEAKELLTNYLKKKGPDPKIQNLHQRL